MIRVIFGASEVTFIPATIEVSRMSEVRCLLGPGPYGSYEPGDTTDFMIGELGRLAAEFGFEVVFEIDQRGKSPILMDDLISAEVASLFTRSEQVPSKGGDVLDSPKIDYRSKYE